MFPCAFRVGGKMGEESMFPYAFSVGGNGGTKHISMCFQSLGVVGWGMGEIEIAMCLGKWGKMEVAMCFQRKGEMGKVEVAMCFQCKRERGKWGKWRKRGNLTTQKSFFWV